MKAASKTTTTTKVTHIPAPGTQQRQQQQQGDLQEIMGQGFRRAPCKMQSCTACGVSSRTRVRTWPNIFTWASCLALLILFWPICWIPLVCDVFKQTDHFCQNCGAKVGEVQPFQDCCEKTRGWYSVYSLEQPACVPHKMSQRFFLLWTLPNTYPCKTLVLISYDCVPSMPLLSSCLVTKQWMRRRKPLGCDHLLIYQRRQRTYYTRIYIIQYYYNTSIILATRQDRKIEQDQKNASSRQVPSLSRVVWPVSYGMPENFIISLSHS